MQSKSPPIWPYFVAFVVILGIIVSITNSSLNPHARQANLMERQVKALERIATALEGGFKDF